MNTKLIENTKLDLSFLKDHLTTIEELQLVNPSASLPFDKDYWLNFFITGYKSHSLLFKLNEEIIGHAAFKQASKDENKVFLCFVYIAPRHRKKGYSKMMIEQSEKFLKKHYQCTDYFLHVRLHNKPAISLYNKIGFSEISRTDENIRMRKVFEIAQ